MLRVSFLVAVFAVFCFSGPEAWATEGLATENGRPTVSYSLMQEIEMARELKGEEPQLIRVFEIQSIQDFPEVRRMLTEEGFLFIDEPLDHDRLEIDLEIDMDFRPGIDPAETGMKIDLRFHVNEGSRYRVGGIRFFADPPIWPGRKAPDYESEFPLRPGDVYD